MYITTDVICVTVAELQTQFNLATWTTEADIFGYFKTSMNVIWRKGCKMIKKIELRKWCNSNKVEHCYIVADISLILCGHAVVRYNLPATTHKYKNIGFQLPVCTD